jgi:beta-galactosidase
MKNLRFYLLVILSLYNINKSFAQRDTIALNNNWMFSIDKKAEGMAGKWFEKELPNRRNVNIPHTWNIETENQNHYGWGWYQKRIAIPASWKNKNVVIQFGAINHTAYIYLNGKRIAEHVGDGFNKFYVNLNEHLAFNTDNIITIATNNDYGTNKVPYGSSFDWPNDGGIIRKVAFIVSNKPAATYIHAMPQLNVATHQGQLKIKVGFSQTITSAISLLINITEENQSTQKNIYTKTIVPVIENNEAFAEISLPNIKPWHFDFPNLYRLDVTILNNKKATDKISTSIGFREIRFDKGRTFLNGERIKLMGVEWTAGSNPDFGFAESDSLIRSQCKLMKDVNAIFTRQHFQQDDLFYDFCDRNGVIVQQEIPLWGPETPANDTIRNIAMNQLQTMVSNMFNHTSIFSWGVGNELRGRDVDMKLMIADLLNRVRQLDTTRKTAYVSNSLTHSFSDEAGFVPDAAASGDYLMMNEYGGSWWTIPQAQISLYLNKVHQSYPDKPFFISEFGLCEPNFKGGDQRRLEDLIYHMAVYESKPYIEGAIYFDLTDYRTHYPGTSDNGKYRRRIHGIYDMYGKPKASMPVLRELSSPIEVMQTRQDQKGKMAVTLFGSLGLPEHEVKGYTLYVSDQANNYLQYKAYPLPDIKPGQQIDFIVDDLFNGAAIITILRPTGYVVSQKSFY